MTTRAGSIDARGAVVAVVDARETPSDDDVTSFDRAP
jgi:hypothetical protein|tara:strand:- start:1753 stop:1863 length:111 start_codon:yes stop_codon:yes gene_type:complete